MGHGKETPRQKMIGMMYLVLTALLALNVSKDVLNAFVLVDEGLVKTNENFHVKNEGIYAEFERAAAENPKKAQVWLDKANEVKQLSNDLFNKIHELKLKIIKTSEGDDTPAVTAEGEIHGTLIGGKDNTDVPAQIMVGDNNDGEGRPLRTQIEKYRETLLEMVGEDAPGVRESIEKALDTKDAPLSAAGHGGGSWESQHFENLPLIAVLTIMSGLQNNIRNAETETLQYLYSQIDAGSFKFNKLEAVVIPNSTYVVRGGSYEAKVFIAASDTTQNPKILIGPYEEKRLEDGTMDYNMVGRADSITVVNGIGTYKVGAGATGVKKWGGLIVLKSPKGGPDIKRPFKAEYSVEEPSMTVSPTKMNVFYLGLDNPVKIAVSGVPAEKVVPTISNGVIKKISGNEYIVNPARQGNAIIKVVAEMDGQKREMGFEEFRVKTLPTPVAKIAGLRGGGIPKSTLLAQSGIIAEMENFEFNAPVKVVSFKVSAKIGQFDQEEASNSNKFSEKQLDIFNRVSKGAKVYFEDIKAALPDGTVRDLGTILLKIN